MFGYWYEFALVYTFKLGMIQKPIPPDCKRRSTPCFVLFKIFGRISGTVSLIKVNSLSFRKIVLRREKNNTERFFDFSRLISSHLLRKHSIGCVETRCKNVFVNLGYVNPFQIERDFARIQVHPENHDRSVFVFVRGALAIEVDVILVATWNLRVEHLPSNETLVEERHPVILKQYVTPSSIFETYLFIYIYSNWGSFLLELDKSGLPVAS